MPLKLTFVLSQLNGLKMFSLKNGIQPGWNDQKILIKVEGFPNES